MALCCGSINNMNLLSKWTPLGTVPMRVEWDGREAYIASQCLDRFMNISWLFSGVLIGMNAIKS